MTTTLLYLNLAKVASITLKITVTCARARERYAQISNLNTKKLRVCTKNMPHKYKSPILRTGLAARQKLCPNFN